MDLIDLVKRIPRSRARDVVGCQLLRSGTSMGVNYREANRAESGKDFLHKVGIATKETAETEYWPKLIKESEHLKTTGTESLLSESRELLAILTSIGRNAKSNQKQ